MLQIKLMLQVGGLMLDIVGASLLFFGEVFAGVGLFHYWITGEGGLTIRSFPFWTRPPVWLAKYIPARFGRTGSPNEQARNYARSAWGAFFLVLGFLLQAIGTMLPETF